MTGLPKVIERMINKHNRAIRRRMSTFWRRTSPDWCHICGVRSDVLVAVIYSSNAENDSKNDGANYLRICSECIQQAESACGDS